MTQNSHKQLADKDMADFVLNTLKTRLEKHARGKIPVESVSHSGGFSQNAAENRETVFVSTQKEDPAATAASRQQFLELLAEGLTVSEACLRAGLARASVYRWRSADYKFRLLWDDAEEIGADRLEVEADRRGMTGWEETLYYKGSVVGVRRRYSDRMLMFRLRALKPGRYSRVRG